MLQDPRTRSILEKMKQCKGPCLNTMKDLESQGYTNPLALINKVKEIRDKNKRLYTDLGCPEACLLLICEHLNDLGNINQQVEKVQ